MSGGEVDHAARAENIRWFVETGESLNGAARRLGIGVAGVQKWCALHGMAAELAALRARDPFNPEPSHSESGRIGALARWAS